MSVEERTQETEELVNNIQLTDVLNATKLSDEHCLS
jgi:hypothetical protein